MAGSVVAFGKKKKDESSINEQMENDPFEIDYRKYKSPHQEDSPKKVEEGEGPWLVSYADLMTLLMGFFALIASMSKPDVKAVEAASKSAVEKFGGKYNEPYKDLDDKISQAMKKEIAEGKLKVTHAADGVTILFDGATFFDSGAFVLKSEGVEIVTKIVNSVKKDVPVLKSTVEGHTDNIPISQGVIASNWELSGIRAARVAEQLEQQGFTKKQLTIQGWGETRPEVPNQDEAGKDIPVNQAKNRRVLIRFYKEL